MTGRDRALRLLNALPAPARSLALRLAALRHAGRGGLAVGRRLVTGHPSAQHAIDIFAGRWASEFAAVRPGLRSGGVDLFAGDPRPAQAARELGRGGRLDGMTVLELGPLEGAHTYRLEQLGADVTAVEANAEAYLKCLVTKEVLGLRRARFLLGDFQELLAADADRYDLIFASGVLYHMADPVRLVELVAARTDACFVWTHYYDPTTYRGLRRTPRRVRKASGEYVYYELAYPDTAHGAFWGGNRAVASWLERDAVVAAFEGNGMAVKVLEDERSHPHGACLSLVARRGRAAGP